jgi:hypothetical protein
MGSDSWRYPVWTVFCNNLPDDRRSILIADTKAYRHRVSPQIEGAYSARIDKDNFETLIGSENEARLVLLEQGKPTIKHASTQGR